MTQIAAELRRSCGTAVDEIAAVHKLSTSVCMVENNQKYSKMMKKVLFFFIFLPFSSCTLHEPLVRMMEKVLFSLFFNVFDRFRPCERMHKHEFAG